MDQDLDRHPDVVVANEDGDADAKQPGEVDGDHQRDARLTRRVHVLLGLVIAALGAWLLYRSHTELDYRGANREPGPGYLPVLLTICLIGLGLTLTAVWLFGPRARSGEAPRLKLNLRHMARALFVWLALVMCALLIEPLGFLIAGEVLVVVVILVIERMRAIPSIIALLLVPPAMYLLFATLLDVQLPGGTLWQ
jgi:tryptophan-rich sensory protein